MRLHLIKLILAGSTVAAWGQQNKDMAYKEAPEWPAQVLNAAGTPAGPWNFIQVSGVAVNAQGHVLVLHRGAHPILEFESGGKFLRSWGDGMFSEGKVVAIAARDRVAGKALYSAVYGPAGCDSCGAHSIRIDPDHNIWVVDAPGQVIYKMDPKGKTIMQLGQKGVRGSGHNTFNLPTDIAFAANGDLYVTDGYAGSRVVKFSRDGKYLQEWGSRGTGPGQFELPHNVVTDAEGRVYVTDRETKRIEVFDSSGRFLYQFPTAEGVSGLFITKDRRIWAGGVLVNLKGEVLTKLPGGSFGGAHAVAVAESGDVYLAQLSGKVQKFIKQ